MYEGREAGGLTPQKLEFARSAAEADRVPKGSSLLEAVQQLRPSALVGAAAKQNAFEADTIKALTKVVTGLRAGASLYTDAEHLLNSTQSVSWAVLLIPSHSLQGKPACLSSLGCSCLCSSTSTWEAVLSRESCA